jgi:hypothetical protein
MKFKQYRRGCSIELAPEVELWDRAALVAHLRENLEPWPTLPVVRSDTVRVLPWLLDTQTGMHIHLVRVRDYGMVGTLESPRDISDP